MTNQTKRNEIFLRKHQANQTKFSFYITTLSQKNLEHLAGKGVREAGTKLTKE